MLVLVLVLVLGLGLGLGLGLSLHGAAQRGVEALGEGARLVQGRRHRVHLARVRVRVS